MVIFGPPKGGEAVHTAAFDPTADTGDVLRYATYLMSDRSL